jgi:hypothetical protein
MSHRHQYTHPLSSMSKNPKNPGKPDKFKFLTEKSIRQEKFEITSWQLQRLRSKLPEGIYWLQIEKRGLVHWNWTILQNYLLNGADCIEHRALVAEYIATLPQAT